MSILQLVYKSLAADGVDDAEVLGILRVSQTRNQRERISGLLVFQAPVFVQLLEGPPEAVEALYARIAADPRHHTVELIERRAAERAAMPTWAMGYFSPSAVGNVEAGDGFVFNAQQVARICQALPPHIGGPFLDVVAP